MVYEVLDLVLAGEYRDREEFQSMEGRGLALANKGRRTKNRRVQSP